LLGFLFVPALIQVADGVGQLAGIGPVTAATSARTVIVLSAVLGGVMMIGLTRALPAMRAPDSAASKSSTTGAEGHTVALCWLSVMVTIVLAGFEVGIVLQGQQHADMSTRSVAMMFAECSLVMLFVNAALFFSGMLEKVSSRVLIAAGLLLAAAGLAVMAWHTAEDWLYVGISLTSAGTGLVLPVIAYLAAGVSHQKLGATMGALAAASGFGQTLGSSLSGWLFGAIAQRSFALLMLPLGVMLVFLAVRPGWWSGQRERLP
jgi:MFS family permease